MGPDGNEPAELWQDRWVATFVGVGGHRPWGRGTPARGRRPNSGAVLRWAFTLARRLLYDAPASQRGMFCTKPRSVPMRDLLKRLRHEDDAATAVEYSLIAAIVGV